MNWGTTHIVTFSDMIEKICCSQAQTLEKVRDARNISG